MAKKFDFCIKKIYEEVDKSGDFSTILADIEWNGKPSKGLDIRHQKDGTPYKGIAVSHEGLDAITDKLVELGYGHSSINTRTLANQKVTIEEEIEKVIEEDLVDSKEEEPVMVVNFDNIFSRVRTEKEKYTRDRFGVLRDDSYRAVILKRNKKELD